MPHAKRRCPPARSAGAWERVMSMALQCCVTIAVLVSFAAFLIMMPFVLAVRDLRRQARRYRSFSPNDHPPPPPPRQLASFQISRLPSFESSPFDRTSACVVCLESSRGGERWRALPPCGHAFHTACVDPWLLLSPVCPVCRATVAILPRSESQAGDGIEKQPLSLYLSPPHAGLQRHLGM
ncbi:E3 ubiquitin-protein ligase ATL23-like [Lolium perenne]|uniref:E3 ubiquitin-protein ligase ATL23-like n=1 Tax=Lolium perenne TaxID=4522 RepID=UPI0021F64062|nr:RING-H2 finger protein ATL39-like [Lolium perenne]